MKCSKRSFAVVSLLFAVLLSLSIGTLNARDADKNTTVGIDAEGNPTVVVFMHIYDGKPYPTTGSPIFDASAYTRPDANTLNFNRLKAGKVVQTGTTVITPDGKSYTVTTTGTDANGRQINNIAVYDKQ